MQSDIERNDTSRGRWDFSETGLTTVWYEGYPYKIQDDSDLQYLVLCRMKIEEVCKRLYALLMKGQFNDDMTNKVELFLDLHMEKPISFYGKFRFPPFLQHRADNYRTTSKYLLSIVPAGGRRFDGINKPRMRYMSNEVPIGDDGRMRAAYRDVFLRPGLSEKKLNDLLIHELSHTGCNHVTWKDDNHGPPFKEFEKVIKSIW